MIPDLQRIRAVLFDKDSTLLDDVHMTIAEHQAMVAEGIAPICARLGLGDSLELVRDYWRVAGAASAESPRTVTQTAMWAKVLGRDGRSWPPEVVIAIAHEYNMADITQLGLFADARDTLDELARMGYRLGLVSNALAPAHYWRAWLARVGIAHRLDAVVVSSEVEWRKPHPGIFHHALTILGVRPEEALFVGDDVYSDIYGAHQVGMATCWLANDRLVRERPLEPDLTIGHLAEVPELLRQRVS